MPTIVVLSGPVGVGKTAYAQALLRRFEVHKVSTRHRILSLKAVPETRAALQVAGEELDRETGGAWVADAVADEAERNPTALFLLVDAARIPDQLTHLRARFGPASVYHVHLTAPDNVLEERYSDRQPEMREFDTYAEVRSSGTEAQVGNLASMADVILDTTSGSPVSLVARSFGSRFPNAPTTRRLVDVIVGGQYGSEGKGNVCSFLAKEYEMLVRIGGPNAGHKVADPEYKYMQLPSGSMSNPDAMIVIGAGSTIWLPQLLTEIADHKIPEDPKRLVIDRQAMIIDEEDRKLETELLSSISSTKQGVGSASARKIMNRGSKLAFGPPVLLAGDESLTQLNKFTGDGKAEIEAAIAAGRRVLIEGTQGTALSIHHGSYPNVTSRETSASGCLADAGVGPIAIRKVYMVVRSYPIRVGGESGPMGKVIEWKDVEERSGKPLGSLCQTEKGTVSGKLRRVAEFDLDQVTRAATQNGATDIVLTFADYLSVANESAKSYDQLTPETRRFIETIERSTGVPVSLVSVGFGRQYMIDRRI
jgi:adenylosuccinate synthase